MIGKINKVPVVQANLKVEKPLFNINCQTLNNFYRKNSHMAVNKEKTLRQNTDAFRQAMIQNQKSSNQIKSNSATSDKIFVKAET